MPSGRTISLDGLALGETTHGMLPNRTGGRRKVDPNDREFIAWDGEGTNLNGPNLPQSYTLFGSSAEKPHVSQGHIHTFALLDHIIEVGKKHPGAYHVGFAFNYDSNMLLRSLSEQSLRRVHESGHITLRHAESGYTYYIDYLPGKWFAVTRRDQDFDYKSNRHAKTTVKIYDIFSFFGTSFIRAYEDLVGPVPEIVVAGKAARNDFAAQPEGYIERYWSVEIQMLRELAEELRRRLYGAGLRITQWHGPGALASYTLKKHGIKNAMAGCPDPVRRAAAYGYAGGRFEMFKLGRTLGPIYSMDINSAYPFGISQLPNLTTGQWIHTEHPGRGRRIARFGIYRVRLLPRSGGSFLERAPGPLFHRDKLGNISFPWITEGWYWSPEVRNLFKLNPDQYEIVEGWEYVGGFDGKRPFEFVEEAYRLRREWKVQGNASQLALKLMLNSLYGKMAQRVGWNQEKRTAPTWHQLEWAGWTTSNCRAMLWDLMSRIPWSELLAVETDGLYTTHDPADLGLTNSKELGGWEIEVYDELLYVQSGLAWLRKGDKWVCKRRGLDARTFGLADCRDYLRTLGAKSTWLPYVGSTTRFIGLGAALTSSAPFKLRHCVWNTVDREIRPGQGGKRVHISGQCAACAAGMSAYDGAHDMSVRSLAYRDAQSFPHDIPWEDQQDPGYLWRSVEDIGYADPVAL
jgi:hypothetical protein